MKVFFSGSYKGADKFSEQYKAIFDLIKKNGYEHLDYDIVNVSYDQLADSNDDSAFDKHYEKKMKAIKNADICIFETTVHSLGIGFLIQKALDDGKPVISLYYKDNQPYFLSGLKDERFILKSYNDESLTMVLKEALETARERRDKRFNFFISPKLLEYLEKASKKEGFTKSKFIRNLIMDHMRENRFQD